MLSKLIISEQHLPNSEKLLKQTEDLGIAGKDSYVWHLILYYEGGDKFKHGSFLFKYPRDKRVGGIIGCMRATFFSFMLSHNITATEWRKQMMN